MRFDRTNARWPAAAWIAVLLALSGWQTAAAAEHLPIERVSYGSPADPYPIPAIDCVNSCPPGYEAKWNAMTSVPDFQVYAQGEYVGRARLPHVSTYRLRVDDQLEFVFRVDSKRLRDGYRLNVGDTFNIESAADRTLGRTLVVLPDGTITLPHVGQLEAAGLTLGELRNKLDNEFKKYYDQPAITLTADRLNSKLEDLRYTVAGQSGFGGQILQTNVTPEGTIQLPAVGSVPAQGLTLDEFKLELDERFAEKIQGMEVVPVLKQHAPRSVYVLGEVAFPGRYELDAPTTVMQALAMAGSWTVGGKIAHVVVLRRADDWRLLATELQLTTALVGKTPCPGDEIWVADCDLIIVPKSKIERANNFIDLVFTRGVYGVVPIGYAFNYSLFKGVFPIPVAPFQLGPP